MPKDPSEWQLCLQRGLSSPYRPTLRSEYDLVPVQRVAYPLGRSVTFSEKANVSRPNIQFDLSPIQRENFDLNSPAKSESDISGKDRGLRATACGSTRQHSSREESDELDEIDKDLVDISPARLYSKNTSQMSSPLTTPSRSPSPVLVKTLLTVPTRTIHKIRDKRNMAMFSSTGPHALGHPLQHDIRSPPVIGDIYRHSWGAGPDAQLWTYTADGEWKRIQAGALHPKMRTHCLYQGSRNECPRWVSRKTVSTYTSRDALRHSPEY